MAVRAAETPLGCFSGSRLARVNRAKAPNTASQKDMAIQAKRIAKRTRIAVSLQVKSSTWNTPVISVTAATVEARTRNRYSQRRGAMSSGTAADGGGHQHQGA